jgi:hypothetical protein
MSFDIYIEEGKRRLRRSGNTEKWLRRLRKRQEKSPATPRSICGRGEFWQVFAKG